MKRSRETKIKILLFGIAYPSTLGVVGANLFGFISHVPDWFVVFSGAIFISTVFFDFIILGLEKLNIRIKTRDEKARELQNLILQHKTAMTKLANLEQQITKYPMEDFDNVDDAVKSLESRHKQQKVKRV